MESQEHFRWLPCAGQMHSRPAVRPQSLTTLERFSSEPSSTFKSASFAMFAGIGRTSSVHERLTHRIASRHPKALAKIYNALRHFKLLRWMLSDGWSECSAVWEKWALMASACGTALRDNVA